MAEPNYDTERATWAKSLEDALPNAGTDALKLALDHVTKLLDNVYASNDAISQKARWGIGVIMGVVIIGLKASFDSETNPSAKLSIPGGYLLSLGCLFVGLLMFLYIAFSKSHRHSGMEPFRYRLGQWITYGNELKDSISDETSSKKSLEFGYVVLITMQEYQERITTERATNRKISLAFDMGMACIVVGFGAWVITFLCQA